jgi:soluble lytic murein transglycosylase-like protein
LRSIVLAGAAAMFAPQPGHVAPRPAPSTLSAVTSITFALTSAPFRDETFSGDRPPESQPAVAVAAEFRLAPSAFEPLIAEAAARYHLDPALVRAVIRTESAFDPRAISSAGALGLMQLMPDLAEELGVTDPFDPRANVMAGTGYLSRLLADHGGDLALALASYNAGPATVAQYQGIPPFPETQRYVATITALLTGGPSAEHSVPPVPPPAPDDDEDR